MNQSIHDILAQFREDTISNRELGDRFERLICRYLELDPTYKDRFSNVWMWNEFPKKGDVGDVGVDLVAEERYFPGEYCAIQCKFYLPENTVSKKEIDSFYTAVGNPLFTSGIIVSTTDKWGPNAEHARTHQTKQVLLLTVHDLDASPVDWSKFDSRRPQDLGLQIRRKPKPHQEDAVRDVVKGLAAADRGKLIMACGVLHSPEYRTRFASDLKKMLPRIPFTSKTADFWKFSQAGRDLAKWHLNYDTIEPYAVQEHTDALGLDPAKDFLVQPKMVFGRKNKQVDKTTIIYNSHVTISGIPLGAYDYVVNGKPAIEWIMERYQITVDKDSGIRNDPNDWAREHDDPKYILNLLKRVITVSMETMKIVNVLPALNERKTGK